MRKLRNGTINVRYVPIRNIQLVIDVEDPLSPVLTLRDFKKIYNTDPLAPRYRTVTIEVLTCPEDGYVILSSECSACSRFIKRVKDMICCYASIVKI